MRKESVKRGAAQAFLAWAFVCGCSEPPSPVEVGGELLASAPALLVPGVIFKQALATLGAETTLVLTRGALPDGIYLTSAGTLEGMPLVPGQVARFTIERRSSAGEPLDERDYLLVGAEKHDIAVLPKQSRDGDVLRFEGGGGGAIHTAWAWDDAFGLVWPLKKGLGVDGGLLAPPSGALTLVVVGDEGQSQFDVHVDAPSREVAAFAQLAWEASADIDLHVLSDTGDEFEVNARENVWESDGTWRVRHDVEAKEGPGAESVSFSRSLPPGRYALAASRAGGDAIDVPLWLSVRTAEGRTLSDMRIDALLSDISSGDVRTDLKGSAQAYVLLGVLVVGVDAEWSFEPRQHAGSAQAARTP